MGGESLNKVIKEISNEILYLFRQVLSSEVGINKKIGRNTLTGDIYESVRTSADFPIIYLYVNSYIDYIESGLRKGVFVPIKVLVDWAKKRGISTDNNTIYAIQRGIYNQGIEPRPIFDNFDELITRKYWDNWADKIFNSIWEEL